MPIILVVNDLGYCKSSIPKIQFEYNDGDDNIQKNTLKKIFTIYARNKQLKARRILVEDKEGIFGIDYYSAPTSEPLHASQECWKSRMSK
jgi:hypothetical protein